MALVISLVLFLGHTVSDEKVPCSQMWIGGNEARVSMVMLVTPSLSEGLGIVRHCPPKKRWRKEGETEGKGGGRSSDCDIQMIYTREIQTQRKMQKKKKWFNGAVKSSMTARDRYKFNQKSYVVHPNSI